MENKFSKFLSRNFIFCDVGAREGLEEPWKTYKNFIDVVSFEPDLQEYEELKKRKTERDIVLPYALLNEEKKLNLNFTKSKGSTSIYEPNSVFLERFPDADRFMVEEKKIVDTTTLDILFEKKVLEEMDFIKLDTQGAELDILIGGEKLLDENILGVQVEVEFKRMYRSQPLFNEVDMFIRDKFGLVLFDIRKTYWKFKEGRGKGPSKGQLIFGDALYFRDPYEIPKWCEQFEIEEAKNKIIMACLMGIIYGYPDYSICVLNQPTIVKRMGVTLNNKLRSLIIQYSRCIKFSFLGSRKIWKIANLLSKIFEPDNLKIVK